MPNYFTRIGRNRCQLRAKRRTRRRCRLHHRLRRVLAMLGAVTREAFGEHVETRVAPRILSPSNFFRAFEQRYTTISAIIKKGWHTNANVEQRRPSRI